MAFPIRRVVADAVAAATPEEPTTPTTGTAPRRDASSVSPFPAASPLHPVTAPGSFERGFQDALADLDTSRQGSTVVSQALRQALTGALMGKRSSPSEREAKVLEALVPMFRAGRGPALEALRELVDGGPRAGLPLTPGMRDAIAAALLQIETSAVEAGSDAVARLSKRAELDPTVVRDVAQLGWVLNLGTETQRAEVVMRVLLLESGSPLGDLCAQARRALEPGGSTLVSLSAAEREAVAQLVEAWPGATRERKAELMATHGRVFNTLERLLGGAMVGVPPGYVKEQLERGNRLPAWVSSPLSTAVSNDLAIVAGAEQLRERLAGGAR